MLNTELDRTVLIRIEGDTPVRTEVTYLDTIFDQSVLLNEDIYLISNNTLYGFDTVPIFLRAFDDPILQIENTDSTLLLLANKGLFEYKPMDGSVSQILLDVTSQFSQIQQWKVHSASDFAISGIDHMGNFVIIKNNNLPLLTLDSTAILHNFNNYIFEYDSAVVFIASEDLFGQAILYKYMTPNPKEESTNYSDMAFIGFEIDSVRPETYVEDGMTYNHGFYYRVNFEVENQGQDTIKSLVFHANRREVTCQGSPPWHTTFELSTVILPGERTYVKSGEIWDPVGGPPIEDYSVCFLISGPNGGYEKDTSDNTACDEILITRNNTHIFDPLIRIFPNPSHGILTLESSKDISSVELLDLRGKVLIKNSMENDQIDLSSMPASMYFLRIIALDGRISIRRIVKI